VLNSPHAPATPATAYSPVHLSKMGAMSARKRKSASLAPPELPHKRGRADSVSTDAPAQLVETGVHVLNVFSKAPKLPYEQMVNPDLIPFLRDIDNKMVIHPQPLLIYL
jgi:hypothetical protein